jgi:type III pantothenate kinase
VIVLAVDAGNSRVKWGIADDSGWLRRGVLDTGEAAALGEAIRALPAPARIVVSNVAGDAVREAITRALAHVSVMPLWVQGRAQQCGVSSGYADPAQLGADRWAALIAAWKLEHAACIVVNAGTTLTVDALSHEGVFLGGIIVPGLELMLDALAHGTAQLKRAPGAFVFFPDNTADAIMSGAVNALAGAIDRISAYMAETGQGTPPLLLSGGSAALLQPRLNARCTRVDNLVLDGLLEIAREGY